MEAVYLLVLLLCQNPSQRQLKERRICFGLDLQGTVHPGEVMATNSVEKIGAWTAAQQTRALALLLGPVFDPQNPRGGSQPFVTSVPGDPVPSSCLCRHCTFRGCPDITERQTLIYIK